MAVHLLYSPFSLSTIFIPPAATQDEFVPAMRRCLQYDELFTFASSFLWLGYLFFDLKQADMVKQNWEALLVMSGLSLACFGPGATLAAGWLWREEILAEKVK